ncbi:LacI family DNA-binding transcriptional regulator [Roseicyclus mahoneyensis]|uniref:LacI family transcriptional regulator n=1 Tax=Roseicyclus mahoneyensis TaxID=164332 RepID=A0A316GHY8_9RHOB|nr:LacI family DNA-binding transcriptional regulator [Roseicyclus mahoneyensis]PWK60581.1 LacI family transcriptional regulator [Roseicyclus mahoneyensis]
MRPTLTDIATAAGVSPATVDRVLHGRPGVAGRTRAQVLQAARRLGYLADLPEAPAPMVFHLVLPQTRNAYFREVIGHARALTPPHVTLEVLRAPALDPAAFARVLRDLGPSDGIAVLALGHPQVAEAIRARVEGGTPVVTLATDIPEAPRTGFVGLDNLRAGRLAGYTLARFLGPAPEGKVALIAGHLGFRGHMEREMGFRAVLAQEFAGLSLLALRETREDRARARLETLSLLAAHPDLVGIYNAGGGTVGIGAALTEAGRTGVVFVAHEATEENRALLLDGTLDAVIDQSAREEMQEVFALLMAAARGQGRDAPPLCPVLITRENLP